MNLLTAVAKVSRDYATWLRRLLLFTSVSENTGGNTGGRPSIASGTKQLDDRDVSHRSNLPRIFLLAMILPYRSLSSA